MQRNRRHAATDRLQVLVEMKEFLSLAAGLQSELHDDLGFTLNAILKVEFLEISFLLKFRIYPNFLVPSYFMLSFDNEVAVSYSQTY